MVSVNSYGNFSKEKRIGLKCSVTLVGQGNNGARCYVSTSGLSEWGLCKFKVRLLNYSIVIGSSKFSKKQKQKQNKQKYPAKGTVYMRENKMAYLIYHWLMKLLMVCYEMSQNSKH